MKRKNMNFGILSLLLCFLVMPATAMADFFVSGSTGADGALAPPISPSTYLVPAHDDGVYNFTTVNIPAGVTVTFQKNANNTPITVLASGDVVINATGAISVNGDNGALYTAGVGGPGGFGGGIGGWLNSNGSRGLGPGGGDGSTSGGGNGGTFNYGNDGQIPMIGGSGGSGGAGNSGYTSSSGGGGGGAILIASSGTITVDGAITANGGNGGSGSQGGCCYWTIYYYGGGGGSGGAIRLIATTISGNGNISANGGSRGAGGGGEGKSDGGTGRIRLEAWNFTRTAQTSPALTVNTQKWNPTAIAPTALPTLAITSIGGVAVPAIPTGNSKTPDIQLPANATNPVAVIVSSTNMPSNTTVTVKSLSSIGTTVQTTTATLGGTNDPLTATATINLAVGYTTVLTVSATYTAVASNGSSLYAEGERVDKIRVDTAMGGSSTITYITLSGREIPQKQS